MLWKYHLSHAVKFRLLYAVSSLVIGWHIFWNAFIPGIGYNPNLIPLAALALFHIILGCVKQRYRVQAVGIGFYIVWLSIKVVEYWRDDNLKSSFLYLGFMVFATAWTAVLWSEGKEYDDPE